jgi:hypothetical protein
VQSLSGIAAPVVGGILYGAVGLCVTIDDDEYINIDLSSLPTYSKNICSAEYGRLKQQLNKKQNKSIYAYYLVKNHSLPFINKFIMVVCMTLKL